MGGGLTAGARKTVKQMKALEPDHPRLSNTTGDPESRDAPAAVDLAGVDRYDFEVVIFRWSSES
jgi:hypothetical protein